MLKCGQGGEGEGKNRGVFFKRTTEKVVNTVEVSMSLLRMWLQNRNSKNVAGLHFILKVISQKFRDVFVFKKL